jgi:hypothetical protein
LIRPGAPDDEAVLIVRAGAPNYGAILGHLVGGAIDVEGDPDEALEILRELVNQNPQQRAGRRSRRQSA